MGWEGSGNVICLDVLRALPRNPEAVEAFRDEVSGVADPRLGAFARDLERQLGATDEAGARVLVERMALALQACLLLRHGHPVVADAFCTTRLAGDWGRAYGTLPAGLVLQTIIDRADPKAPEKG